MKTRMLTVRVERERLSDGAPIYVALCLELEDVFNITTRTLA